MDAGITDFQELIQKFSELPNQPREDENLFSICGFPHYERVISNVLAFFLDNQREHGLGNLFIDTLLSFCGHKDLDLNYRVETETPTDKGKFIDIDIIGDEYRIIIENKINASLYNDLNEYFKFASKNGRTVIAFVLSLKPLDPGINKKYTFITYEKLFKELRRRMGEYVVGANQNYLSLFFDLVKNIDNLQGRDSMDYEFIKFVKENQDAVNLMNEKIKSLQYEMRKTVKSVNSLVEDAISSKKIRQWPWRVLPYLEDTAVTDIDFGNVGIGIDSILNLTGWHFGVFIRRANEEFDLETFLKNRSIEYQYKEGKKYFLNQTYGIEESPTVVAEYIIKVITALIG